LNVQDLGRQVYALRCAACHGTDLRGSLTVPSLLSEPYAPDRFDDDAIRAVIRDGIEPDDPADASMPAIGGLSDEQVDAVIDHLRFVQARDGLEPVAP
jgi:mono/diheme cytochrome c family protein